MCYLRGCLIFSAALGALSNTLYADQVKLVSPDGVVNLEGELVSFEDNIYTISTFMGDFRIGTNEVNCLGDACPSTDDDAPGDAETNTASAPTTEVENNPGAIPQAEDITAAQEQTETAPEPAPEDTRTEVATAAATSTTGDNRVTLISISGKVEIMGELLSFDNNIYVLRSALGVISFDGDEMTCKGTACP